MLHINILHVLLHIIKLFHSPEESIEWDSPPLHGFQHLDLQTPCTESPGGDITHQGVRVYGVLEIPHPWYMQVEP